MCGLASFIQYTGFICNGLIDVSGMPHAETLDKIQMTREGGGGQTFKGQDNSPIKAPDKAGSNTQKMVNQLASRYHEDRRKLQLLREQQAQLHKEIETTRFNAWKPSARDEAAMSEETQPDLAHESHIDAQVQARVEFGRQVKFQDAKRSRSNPCYPRLFCAVLLRTRYKSWAQPFHLHAMSFTWQGHISNAQLRATHFGRPGRGNGRHAKR